VILPVQALSANTAEIATKDKSCLSMNDTLA